MTGEFLFVFNGDCALEGFRESRCPLEGELLSWKEVYTEGPLPCHVTLEEFRKIRAGFLADGPAPAGLTPAQLEKHLKRMEETLFSQWKKGGETVLFLDACMFDQGIFARLLFLAEYFRKTEKLFPCLFFTCRDMIYSKEAPFMELYAERQKAGEELLNMAEEIWNSYASCSLPGKELLEKLPPFLRKGLLRRAEENPSLNKYYLTRTERELLFLLQKRGMKGETALNLFTGLDALEEFPFLGDTGCWRLLESLRKRKFLHSPLSRAIPAFTFEELAEERLMPTPLLLEMEL